MPRARKYSTNEVVAMLVQSEGRPSPYNNQPGHPLSMHVDIADHQLTDRIIQRLGTNPNSRPILVGSDGAVVDRATHRTIWKERNPALTSGAANADNDALFPRTPPAAGAFLDLQHAGLVGRIALNSAGGQAALAELDAAGATPTRKEIKLSMNNFHLVGEAWKMRRAAKGGGDKDLPHICDFNSVFMLLDNLQPDGVHIQTFYPIA